MNFREHLKQKLASDPEFRRQWEKDAPAREVIHAIVGVRVRYGWTQKELAERMGTQQAAISRAETTGRVTPEFMARFAAAVGGTARLQVKVPGSRQLCVDVGDLEQARRRVRPVPPPPPPPKRPRKKQTAERKLVTA
jgi:transcriptional regulator with XRE-family HTH domain